MANEMKTLAKETAIYGVSSILGKFLNWCLVPLYTYVLTSSADYGVVANLYAWTALLLVILTYGMETGLFRFLNKEGRDNSAVYPTTVICLFVSSLTFVALCAGSLNGISTALGYPDHQEYVMMLAVVVAMDAFGSIPFAYLRYKNVYQFAVNIDTREVMENSETLPPLEESPLTENLDENTSRSGLMGSAIPIHRPIRSIWQKGFSIGATSVSSPRPAMLDWPIIKKEWIGSFFSIPSKYTKTVP